MDDGCAEDTHVLRLHYCCLYFIVFFSICGGEMKPDHCFPVTWNDLRVSGNCWCVFLSILQRYLDFYSNRCSLTGLWFSSSMLYFVSSVLLYMWQSRKALEWRILFAAAFNFSPDLQSNSSEFLWLTGDEDPGDQMLHWLVTTWKWREKKISQIDLFCELPHFTFVFEYFCGSLHRTLHSSVCLCGRKRLYKIWCFWLISAVACRS